MAMSVPPPMAMPTSAAASAGASLMPSPAMATIWPARRNASTTALFPSGKTSASTSAMPSFLAIASAVPRLSPVSMTMAMPCAFSASSAARVVGFSGSATAMRPASTPSMATKITVPPSPRSRSASPCKAAVAMPSSAKNLALPSATRRRSTMPVTPLPEGASKSVDGEQIDLAFGGRRDDRRGERVFARPLDARGKPQQNILVEILHRHDGGDLGLAFGQRAGLVDDKRVDFLQALERLGVPDQNAGLRGAADADHDRHRRGEPERAGAGDDQHGHGGDQRVSQARLRPIDRPGRKRDQRNGDHRRHEPGGDPVGEPLDRRARALRGGDHLRRYAPAWCRGRLFRRA